MQTAIIRFNVYFSFWDGILPDLLHTEFKFYLIWLVLFVMKTVQSVCVTLFKWDKLLINCAATHLQSLLLSELLHWIQRIMRIYNNGAELGIDGFLMTVFVLTLDENVNCTGLNGLVSELSKCYYVRRVIVANVTFICLNGLKKDTFIIVRFSAGHIPPSF